MSKYCTDKKLQSSFRPLVFDKYPSSNKFKRAASHHFGALIMDEFDLEYDF
jgi:hypothetical protein